MPEVYLSYLTLDILNAAFELERACHTDFATILLMQLCDHVSGFQDVVRCDYELLTILDHTLLCLHKFG